TPQAKLQINAEGNPTNIEDNVNNGLTIKGTDQSLYMGVQSSTHVSYIQSVDYGTTVAPLLLNARGGNVGIGTNNPRNTLDVKGTIHAQEVKVDLSNWSDFVFEKDYKLPTLNEVNTYIENNGHLPDVPSAQEVKENGVSIAKIQAILLQKIEELTLYAIQQQKNILDLESQIQELKPAKK
ncbi:MAG TPA: tail fiber protein, partial [Bacteroidales bacterium]|nr:tail fiber protein [Bacteroidales bacterium]